MRGLEKSTINPKSIHYWLLLVFECVMILGLVLSLIDRQWLNAFIIAGIILLAALPKILGRKFDVYIPSEFKLLSTVLIFASLFLGEIHGYYTRFWWWDLALHGGSGLLMGILGFLLVHVLNQEEHVHLSMEIGFVAFFSFTFSVAIGSIWEIFEFGMDRFFGLNMQKSGLFDTMADLIVNAVGALIISVAGYFYFKSDKTYFLEKWIAKFIERNPQLFKKKERHGAQ